MSAAAGFASLSGMSEAMRISVILPAAGRSRRFGEGRSSKLEADLAGRAVLVRAVELFSGRPEVVQLIVAAPPGELDAFKFKWGDKLGFLGATVVAGGTVERWETVRNALAAVAEDATHVAVHDAARPLADGAMIDRVFAAAATHDAVIPAMAVSQTLKRVEAQPVQRDEQADPLDAILGSAGKPVTEAWRVVETVSRDGLWAVQTPQVFERALLQRAYAAIESGAIATEAITDDAGLVEALGEEVVVVEGDALNLKVTRPDDLKLAGAIVQVRRGKAAGALGPKRKFPTWAESDEY